MNNSMSLVPFRKRSMAVVSRRFHNQTILEGIFGKIVVAMNELIALLDEHSATNVRTTIAFEKFMAEMKNHRPSWLCHLQGFLFSIKEKIWNKSNY